MGKHPAYFRGKQVSATSQGCAQGISGQYGADGLQRNDHPSFFGYGDHFYQLLIFQRSADRDRLPQDHKRDLESGMIDQSNLTFGEFQEMKKILLEERLYYDFLR